MKTKNELQAEIDYLKELMRQAVLDDYFCQNEPNFEAKWDAAIGDTKVEQPQCDTVLCPSCRDADRLSEIDNLFKSYAHLIDAKDNCIMCKGAGKILAEPHEVIE